MSMKGKLGMLAVMAAMMGSEYADNSRNDLRPEDINTTPEEPPKPNGMKMFRFYGVEVWAINEKNARKKAAKLAGI